MDTEHTQLTEKEAKLDSEIKKFQDLGAQQESYDGYYQPQSNASILSQTFDALGSMLATTKTSLAYHTQPPDQYVIEGINSQELLKLDPIDATNKISRAQNVLITQYKKEIAQGKTPLHKIILIQEFLNQYPKLGKRDSEQEQVLDVLLDAVNQLKYGIKITQVPSSEKKICNNH